METGYFGKPPEEAEKYRQVDVHTKKSVGDYQDVEENDEKGTKHRKTRRMERYNTPVLSV